MKWLRFGAVGCKAKPGISALIERSTRRPAHHGNALATITGKVVRPEKWFDPIHVRPTVVAEVEDAALMNHFGSGPTPN
jgi:hypothetical protein